MGCAENTDFRLSGNPESQKTRKTEITKARNNEICLSGFLHGVAVISSLYGAGAARLVEQTKNINANKYSAEASDCFGRATF
ncbi:hypothetical protein [Sphingomonas sp. R-74633]|uniref:hypothetical protein n=1 Tax=Sphingomonas sp. R-74633 TaxID=2751188 RepID=UPI0015D124CF|nr:hypothetical protein [Sphingomonas sp. R-74633]